MALFNELGGNPTYSTSILSIPPMVVRDITIHLSAVQAEDSNFSAPTNHQRIDLCLLGT